MYNLSGELHKGPEYEQQQIKYVQEHGKKVKA
jgi:hypothetical protein